MLTEQSKSKAVRRGSRLGAQLAKLRHTPVRAIGLVIAVVVGYLVLGPVVAVFGSAFRLNTLDALKAGEEPGTWTLQYLERVLVSDISQQIFWRPLTHTLVVAALATTLAFGFGFLLALLVSHYDVVGRRALGFALIIPYMLPSQAFATAWITVFRNRRIGGPKGILEALGATPPDWIAYGPLPIGICLSMNYFPFAFLLFSNAISKIDSSMFEAATVLGVRSPRVVARILLPMLIPTSMSVLLLIVARTLGTFATPYILGSSTVKYDVLATALYSRIQSGESNVAAVQAIALALFGGIFLVTDVVLVRNWQRFVTVGGKGIRRSVVSLRRWRIPASVGAWFCFVWAACLPFLVLLVSSLTREPGVFRPDNFTLSYWIRPGTGTYPAGVLVNEEVLDALANTLLIAGGAAVICGLLGMTIGYVVANLPGSGLGAFLRQVSFLPNLIPGLAFAAAFLTLFAQRRGPIPQLYGSMALVVLVMVVCYLPYSSRSGISSMVQIGREPEEAAMVLGARFTRRFTRITLSMQKAPLVVAIVLPFISGMKELSLVIMLASPGKQLLTTQSLRFLDYGYTPLANATLLIIGLVVMATVFVVQKLTKANIAEGLGE